MFSIDDSLLSRIIASLQNEEACYINPKTNEIIEIPTYFIYDLRNGYQYDFESEDDFLTDDWNRIHQEWEQFIEILPPEEKSTDLTSYISSVLANVL